MPLQPGDVIKSHANVDELINEFDYKPKISVQYGIEKFLNWYKEYYKNWNQKLKLLKLVLVIGDQIYWEI